MRSERRTGDRGARGLRSWCSAVAAGVALVGFALASPQSMAAVHTEKACKPGRYLQGTLVVQGTTCATGRRVTSGYFYATPPGQHTGPANVYGFRCYARTVRVSRTSYNFRINCRRGSARTHFWASPDKRTIHAGPTLKGAPCFAR